MRAPAQWLAAAVALLLAACASVPERVPDASLFDDALFAPQAESISAAAVFAPSPRMLAYIASDIAPAQRIRGRQRGLFEAIYERDAPWLDYDAGMTRTAAEAFEARSGNCLSLVLMTAAFAKQLGLGVQYQTIHSRESWSRGEGMDYLNGHVNVSLLVPGRPEQGALVVDFLRLAPGELAHSRVIPEHTLVAMYMNNRAVELLSARELDRAYWWTRAALRQDPRLHDPVNTLAVIYRARGEAAHAERALRWLLATEPDNYVALDNLAQLLGAQGRKAEAAELAARVRELRPVPPFHYYDLGMAALHERRYAEAKRLFRREMRRDAHYDRFHAALALAHYGLGELDQAEQRMASALENSTTSADRERYARLLARLRAGEHP